MPDDQPEELPAAIAARRIDDVLGDGPTTSSGDTERLFNEANMLRLEGRMFCFDPKEAGRRKEAQIFEETIRLEEVVKQPIIIKPDLEFGYPSPFAYKVLQVIFRKLTEEGFPVPTNVSFSQRELARLVGRPTFGGKDSAELYRAIMQLHTTRVQCSFYDKKTEQWATASFYVLYEALFSGRKSNITTCMVGVHPRIVDSLNNRHYACLNWIKLLTLEPIGMALYKRLFYHFSNLYQSRRKKDELRFEKDYADICHEWLGGLKPEKYRSKILQTQLGRHLAGLKTTGLIRKFEIAKKADGDGLKLVFWPGKGFFGDYDEFYVKQWAPQLRFNQTAALQEVQRPLELVAYFHQRLGHEQHTFADKEMGYAKTLLSQFSFDGVRDLIDFSIEAARETKFAMQYLTAIKGYVPRWEADATRRAAERKRHDEIAGCSFCDHAGYLRLEEPGGRILMHPCPHNKTMIAAIEAHKGFRVVQLGCG